MGLGRAFAGTRGSPPDDRPRLTIALNTKAITKLEAIEPHIINFIAKFLSEEIHRPRRLYISTYIFPEV